MATVRDASGNISYIDDHIPTPGGSGGSGDMLAANNLSDLIDMAISRANLGVEIGEDVSTLVHPGYVSGLWYPGTGSSYASTAVVADVLYATPLVLHKTVTLSGLGIRVTTGVVGFAKFGVYANSAGRPSTLIAAGNQTPITDATADISTTFASNPTLTPGIYWLVSVYSAAPSIAGTATSASFIGAMIGGTAITNAANTSAQANGFTGVGTYAAGPPATFGTATQRTLATPGVCFQVA